jgi:hypothetical protein
MNAHTPGPWGVRGDLHVVSDGGRHIASVIPGIERDSEIQDEADARLIAAAPDLDLLTGVLDSQEANGYVGVQLVADIRAAIARAEGRAP